MSLQLVESGENSFSDQNSSTLAQNLIDLLESPIPGDQNTTYYQMYRRAFISFALSNLNESFINPGQIPNPSEASQISQHIQNIECFMESVILPSIYERENGLKDYPSPSINDTVVVNGIEMKIFVDLFDWIFIDRQYVSAELNQKVEEVALQINELDWKSNDEIKKELFSQLCSNKNVSSLFYYALASSPEMRHSLALFVVDPCIAYLFLQWGFETLPQGGSFFSTCKLDELFRSAEMPFTSGTTTGTTVEATAYPTMWRNASNSQAVIEQDGLAKFALYAIVQRDSWIHSVTSPGSGQATYRDAWRTRLFSGNTSQLNTLCKINEKYNLNAENDLTLSSTDLSVSKSRAVSYQKIFEQLNYKELAKGGSMTPLPELPLASIIKQAPPIDIGGIVPAGGGGGGGGGGGAGDAAAAQEALAAGGGGVLPGTTGAPTLGDVGISLSGTDGKGRKNDYTGPQILLNSGRIILNSNEHLMLFGSQDATLSSRGRIVVDTNETITLFGEDGLFLGIPNKGAPMEKKGDLVLASFAEKLPPGQLFEAGPTPDNESGYEPLVLGDKLANLMDDLLFTLITATSLNPAGTGVWREDTVYHLKILLARVPEMLSTYAFVDGVSHEEARPFPTAPTSLSKSGGTFDPNSVVGNRFNSITKKLEEQERRMKEMEQQRNQDPLSSLPGYYKASTTDADAGWQ